MAKETSTYLYFLLFINIFKAISQQHLPPSQTVHKRWCVNLTFDENNKPTWDKIYYIDDYSEYDSLGRITYGTESDNVFTTISSGSGVSNNDIYIINQYDSIGRPLHRKIQNQVIFNEMNKFKSYEFKYTQEQIEYHDSLGMRSITVSDVAEKVLYKKIYYQQPEPSSDTHMSYKWGHEEYDPRGKMLESSVYEYDGIGRNYVQWRFDKKDKHLYKTQYFYNDTSMMYHRSETFVEGQIASICSCVYVGNVWKCTERKPNGDSLYSYNESIRRSAKPYKFSFNYKDSVTLKIQKSLYYPSNLEIAIYKDGILRESKECQTSYTIDSLSFDEECAKDLIWNRMEHLQHIYHSQPDSNGITEAPSFSIKHPGLSYLRNYHVFDDKGRLLYIAHADSKYEDYYTNKAYIYEYWDGSQSDPYHRIKDERVKGFGYLKMYTKSGKLLWSEHYNEFDKVDERIEMDTLTDSYQNKLMLHMDEQGTGDVVAQTPRHTHKAKLFYGIPYGTWIYRNDTTHIKEAKIKYKLKKVKYKNGEVSFTVLRRKEITYDEQGRVKTRERNKLPRRHKRPLWLRTILWHLQNFKFMRI